MKLCYDGPDVGCTLPFSVKKYTELRQAQAGLESFVVTILGWLKAQAEERIYDKSSIISILT